jgi:hypothetical protein
MEMTPDGSEKLADGIQQLLGHAASLQDQTHEREERDRQQCLVRHLAENAVGNGAEQIDGQKPHLDADEAENETDKGQCEGDRIAYQQHDDQ